MMDKRKYPRVAVDLKVSLHQGKQITHGRALQFSEYGMLVTPPEAAQVGQRYEVLFALPGHRPSFRLRCIVVYSTPKALGVRFEHVPPEVTSTFRSYIQGASVPPSLPQT